MTLGYTSVVALKHQAREALEAGEYARAESYLNDACTKDFEAAQQLQGMATRHLLSAAASTAEIGELKMAQLAYLEAADYFRQAANRVESAPAAPQEMLAEYVAAWGRASDEAGRYTEAEALYQLG